MNSTGCVFWFKGYFICDDAFYGVTAYPHWIPINVTLSQIYMLSRPTIANGNVSKLLK